ncbi:MAG: hypothetical protein ABJG88_01545 [Litorimonas sp.]
MHNILSPIILSLCLCFSVACTAQTERPAQTPLAPVIEDGKNNRVIMLGLIHSGHLDSETYSLELVEQIIRDINPDYILTEIPPDRLADAAAGFAKTGEVTEDRVKVFPEYREVVFPLTQDMNFKIIPAAGWTRGMADYRRKALRAIRDNPERADDWAAYTTANKQADTAIGARNDDPIFIHTDEYDAITKKGLAPYASLFADDLGQGDWERINAAHYSLIDSALDRHIDEGATFLITYGAGHKYWFLEQLRRRDDIDLINPVEFIRGAQEKTRAEE